MWHIHIYSFVLFTSNCFAMTPRIVFLQSRTISLLFSDVSFGYYYSTMRMHGIALSPHFGRHKWKKVPPNRMEKERKKQLEKVEKCSKWSQFRLPVAWKMWKEIKQNNDLTPLKWLAWTHKKCNFVRIIEKEWCFWYFDAVATATTLRNKRTKHLAVWVCFCLCFRYGSEHVCTFALFVISSSSLNWTDIIVFVSFRNIIWCKRNWCRSFQLEVGGRRRAKWRKWNFDSQTQRTLCVAAVEAFRQIERFLPETQWWLDLTGDRTCECEQWSQDSKVHTISVDGCHGLFLSSKLNKKLCFIFNPPHFTCTQWHKHGTSRQSRLIRADDVRYA